MRFSSFGYNSIAKPAGKRKYDQSAVGTQSKIISLDVLTGGQFLHDDDDDDDDDHHHH